MNENSDVKHRVVKQRAIEFDRAARREKSRLIQWAQAGDPQALAMLRSRYRLYFPLVEERLKNET